MTRRRPARVWAERLAGSLESMVPGTVGGRVSNAGRVPAASSAVSRGVAGSGVPASDVAFQLDTFTAAGGAEDLTLTFLPMAESEHVYLNGVFQDEGTVWTRDGVTLSLLSGMGAVAGDLVEVRYAYDIGAPISPATAGVISDDFDRADSATTLNPASDGGTWTVDPGGVFGIDGSRAYNVSGSGGTPTPGTPTVYMAWRDAETNAVNFEVDIFRSGTSGASALWISHDPVTGNGYELSYDSSSGFGSLSVVSNDGFGHPSAAFNPTAWTGGTTRIRFRHDGAGVVEVWQLVSGVWTLISTISDTTHPQTVGTEVGFGTNSPGTDRWDNFEAGPL